MMRIAALSNSPAALHALDFLGREGLLVGVGCASEVSPTTIELQSRLEEHGVELAGFELPDYESQLAQWLHDVSPDVVFNLGFPTDIPSNLPHWPKFGFLNFHNGLLPDYGGASPEFWQILEGETTGGVSVLQVEENGEESGIVHIERMPIQSGDTGGIYSYKIGFATLNTVQKITARLSDADAPLPKETIDLDRVAKRNPPKAEDLVVRWETQTARSIRNLVRAANPALGGATMIFKGLAVQLLQAEVLDAQSYEEGEIPGTVTAVSAKSGVIVRCRDKTSLRLDVVSTDFGVFSGVAFAEFAGISPGSVFANP